MVAVQLITPFVKCHVCIAALAVGRPAAVVAHQQWCETAPVDKQQHLALLVEVLFDPGKQGFSQAFV